MSTGSPVVRVSGLHKRYGRIHALRGLDFEIPSGRLTGFLGPNGAGKTTTFRAILGLTRPNKGDIEVLGQAVPVGLPEIVKRVGVIVEEPGLVKALSGRVNLEVAADTLGFGHDRIDEMLEFVGLTADAHRKLGDYSKGMKQRLALAAAMLGDPELLILDEPLDGLDPAGQKAFRARLRALVDEGKSVVVSTHDLADIEALADYVIVISQGRLVSEGPLEDLLGGGGGIRVVVADTASAIRALATAGMDASPDDTGILVAAGDGSDVVKVLAGAGIYPSEVKPARETLESVFLGITTEGDL
ncbi:MAG TPA: ABC transporter ATP-binding protein [Acidimicrobiia bacterium]|nr:ABC transporter ATP-binding protein [Acidimicrobiia bacterium]